MATLTEKTEVRGFTRPDETRTFEKGKLELVTIGGRTVGKATFYPGWQWSKCVGPVAGTKTCEAAHFGYQLSGTVYLRADDGTETTVRAGEVFSIPPGHDAWVKEGDEPAVVLDFQGMKDYAKPVR